jgi:aminopeptidase YwaD
MDLNTYAQKAHSHITALCSTDSDRRTGSAGNRQATEFFREVVSGFGYETDITPFETLDHIDHGSSLILGEALFEVQTSPYSPGCDVEGELACVSTIEKLERMDCTDRVLLMSGPICAEQLMPKNFVFYNPDHHRKLIALLESKQPAALIAATSANPEQVGALAPFPLFVDGDFDIPSVYCRDEVGTLLGREAGREAQLKIDAQRVPALASNVIASRQRRAPEKVVLTAHIDTYGGTPGALDNASGVAVLLLAAELLQDYSGELGLEIAALNGEDHYSAGGQMDYLRRYQTEFPAIKVAINIDDVGYVNGGCGYSFYGLSDDLELEAARHFEGYGGISAGEPWFNGDHMIFVQNEVPSLAFTAVKVHELMSTITHTPRDVPEMVDCRKLAELAMALDQFIRSI